MIQKKICMVGAFGTGKTWMRCTESFKIRVEGAFGKGVYSKDLMLHLIGLIGAEGANYKALEFSGGTIRSLSMDARATLSNMAVECGAKVGLIGIDDVSHAWLKEHGRSDVKSPDLTPDKNAAYERVIEIDAAKLKPTLSCPHFVDNTKTIDEVERVHGLEVTISTTAGDRAKGISLLRALGFPFND